MIAVKHSDLGKAEALWKMSEDLASFHWKEVENAVGLQ